MPSRSSKRRGRIEIIPLIDIIFFLLATFVMVSLSMVQNQGISVRLPKAVSGEKQEAAPRVVTVTVAATSDVYLNKEKVTYEQLLERLQALRKEDPEIRVVFNGDSLAYFGDVVRALDETRKSGLTKIAIQTTGAAQPGAPASGSAR